jgi:hypothetical protein
MAVLTVRIINIWYYDVSNDIKNDKTNSIQASHVLTHRTTGWTRRSLTSGIGRDRVQFT